MPATRKGRAATYVNMYKMCDSVYSVGAGRDIGLITQAQSGAQTYLRGAALASYDINLEVWLQGEAMPDPHRLSATNFKHLYWSMAQQLAHHTSNGCNLQPGDLLASGTISGPMPGSRGSLLELAWRGTQPLQFPNGETRSWLQDGDEVMMTGWCAGSDYRVGFGEVTGKVLPAKEKLEN